MMVFTNRQFTGFWPVGSAAVVVADSAERAAEILNQSLIESGLPGDAKVEQMRPLVITEESVRILCDGNY